MTVVPFPDPPVESLVGPAKCLHCGHEFVAVSEPGVFYFTCPACGLDKAVRAGLCQPPEGAEIWTCECGSEALYAAPEALRCLVCGARQTPFD